MRATRRTDPTVSGGNDIRSIKPCLGRVTVGDCITLMRELPDGSIDACICDPPYAEVNRPYGRLTEAEWWDLMMGVCTEVRRVLKPSGSAMFVLQPNSAHVGQMRPWVFEFQAWVCHKLEHGAGRLVVEHDGPALRSCTAQVRIDEAFHQSLRVVRATRLLPRPG